MKSIKRLQRLKEDWNRFYNELLEQEYSGDTNVLESNIRHSIRIEIPRDEWRKL